MSLPLLSPIAASAAPQTGREGDMALLATDRALRTLNAEWRDIAQHLNRAIAGRERLAVDLRTATGPEISSLSHRLSDADAFIVQLRGNLDRVSAQISRTQNANRSAHVAPPAATWHGWAAGGGIVALGVVIPMFVIAVRRLLRRRTTTSTSPGQGAADARRLELAVGAIATEIERMSAHQRLVNQLLADDAAVRRARQHAASPDSQPVAERPVRALGAGEIPAFRPREKEPVWSTIAAP